MDTITHDFSPNDSVYIVTECETDQVPTIVTGTVIQVLAEVNTQRTSVTYNVSTRRIRTMEVESDNIFGTKEEAMTAFGLLIE